MQRQQKKLLSEAVDIIEIFKEEPTGGSLACYLPHHLHSVCRMASWPCAERCCKYLLSLTNLHRKVYFHLYCQVLSFKECLFSYIKSSLRLSAKGMLKTALASPRSISGWSVSKWKNCKLLWKIHDLLTMSGFAEKFKFFIKVKINRWKKQI